jgi:hypothetical protein
VRLRGADRGITPGQRLRRRRHGNLLEAEHR